MSRGVSSTFKSAVFAQQTDEVFLVLLEIYQSAIGYIRIVNNYENVTSGGNVYTAFPFTIQLPEDSDERMPSATVVIDNVDQAIVQAVRSMTGPAQVTIKVVLASAPDTVQAGPYVMTLRDCAYDASQVTGRLDVEDMLNEPYPGDLFTPTNFPGMF